MFFGFVGLLFLEASARFALGCFYFGDGLRLGLELAKTFAIDDALVGRMACGHRQLVGLDRNELAIGPVSRVAVDLVRSVPLAPCAVCSLSARVCDEPPISQWRWYEFGTGCYRR